MSRKNIPLLDIRSPALIGPSLRTRPFLNKGVAFLVIMQRIKKLFSDGKINAVRSVSLRQ